MSAKLERLWAASSLGALFPAGALLTVAPWEQAGRRRTHAGYDRDLVRALLTGPPLAATFLDLDPRDLRANQPSVTRAGVAYYLDDGYRRHGRTYADQGKVGNKYPVVYRRDGQNLILSGHHRAAAALLRGKPYRARVIEGPWGPERGQDVDVVSLERREMPPVERDTGTVFLTPSLLIGVDRAGQLPHVTTHQVGEALATIIRASSTAWMPFHTSSDLVRDAIAQLSPTPEWAAHQLHYAATGRLLPVE